MSTARLKVLQPDGKLALLNEIGRPAHAATARSELLPTCLFPSRHETLPKGMRSATACATFPHSVERPLGPATGGASRRLPAEELARALRGRSSADPHVVVAVPIVREGA